MERVQVWKKVEGNNVVENELVNIGNIEKPIQDILENNPIIVEPGMTIVGRELLSIDLLGIDKNNRFVVIECKQERNSKDDARKVIGQALDYYSKISEIDDDDKMELKNNIRTYLKGTNDALENRLEKAFKNNPRIIIAAYNYQQDAIDALERVASALSGYGMSINVLSLRSIKNSDYYLAQLLISQGEIQAQEDKVAAKRVPWTLEEFIKEIKDVEVKNKIDQLRARADARNLKTIFGSGEPAKMSFHFKGKSLMCIDCNGEFYINPDNWPLYPMENKELLEKYKIKSAIPSDNDEFKYIINLFDALVN